MNQEPEIPIHVLLSEERERNRELTRAKALRESYGIHFYVPHAKQDKFHRAAEHTGRYCRTGNRGGKTKCGAAEDVAFCLGYRPWYLKRFEVKDGQGRVVRIHDPANPEDFALVTKGIPQRPIKLLLIVTDWDKSKEIFTNNEGSYENWGEYFQMIPKESQGRVNKSRGGHIDRIDIKRPKEYGGGVSSIYIDTIESYKHAKMSAESSDWDVIHLDEPCPKAMFTAHKRGLVDRNGKFWINCTPITEMWINDEFAPPKQHVVKEAPNGISFNKSESGEFEISRFMITWSISDNPHNTPEAIAEFAAGLTREERECRLSGLPLAMAGLVYKDFIWDEHVLSEVPKGWEDYNSPPMNYTRRVWWDFHISKPQAVLIFDTAPDGTVFVTDEQFYTNLVHDNAALLKEKIGTRFCPELEIDPSALIDNPVDGTNITDILSMPPYDLWFLPASKDRAVGTIKTKEKLRERHPVSKKPTIFFSPNLAQTLFEFTHYVYDLDTGKPVDKDDHMMENLYRAILNGLSYVEPPKDSDYSPSPFVIRDGMDHAPLHDKAFANV